jgi:hypothetical protein
MSVYYAILNNWDFTSDLTLRLNNLPDDPAVRRVVGLIEKMQRAAAITEQLESRNPKFNEWYLNERVAAYDKLKSVASKQLLDLEDARIKFQAPLSQALYDEAAASVDCRS